jgi:hypothetical protein
MLAENVAQALDLTLLLLDDLNQVADRDHDHAEGLARVEERARDGVSALQHLVGRFDSVLN